MAYRQSGFRRFGSLIVHSALPLLVLFLVGCASTRNTAFQEIDEKAQQGRFLEAAELVERQSSQLYSDRDRVLFYLDKGMLLHYAGDHQQSFQMLSEAERLIEEYFTRSISQEAMSLLVNDTQRNYVGEDFEDVYVNVFNALNFLSLQETERAFVEVRRINNKLNLLEDRYQQVARGVLQAQESPDGLPVAPGTNRFYNSALARYLSLVMYRAAGNWDSVRIDWNGLEAAFRDQGNLYPFPIPLTAQAMVPPEDTRLSVLAFTGRSPVKFASTLWVITGDDWITIAVADEQEGQGRVLQDFDIIPFPGVQSGYRFKFEIPRMVSRGSEVDHIRVFANGELLGELGLLEDIERIAVDTFQIREPVIFLRTVTRAVVKGIAAQRAGQVAREAGAQMGSGFGILLEIFGPLAASLAVEATEQADLRISRFFPAFAHVGEWDLPSGEYELVVEYRGSGSILWRDEMGTVRVIPGEPNIVQSVLKR